MFSININCLSPVRPSSRFPYCGLGLRLGRAQSAKVFGFQSLGAGLGMALGGLIGALIFDQFGSYNYAWAFSIAASLGGVVCILLLEPTSRVLIPDWEESLPAEARATAATP